MSRGIAAATSHRRYGAMDVVPDVSFVDPNTKDELEKSCERVGKNIQIIISNTRKLERDVGNFGTARDSQNLRDSVRDTQLKNNELITETLDDLKRIGEISRSAKKQTKLQVERLQTEMGTAVPIYIHVQKQIAEKSRQHILQQPVSPTEDADQFHLREQEAAYNQQERQLQMELEFEDGLLTDRYKRIKGAEVEILDVNDIMRMLASIVHEQAPIIDTIEQNTENTLANVEAANEELIKASNHMSRRRRTVFCVSMVAIVVVVILIIILVAK